MRPDTEPFQPLVIVDEIVEAAERERDVVKTRRVGLAFRQRPGVQKGDPVMLVVIADERDAFGFVKDLGTEHRAVPLDHLAPAIGLQHDMRQLFG
jgi:hypothetical protein